MRPRYTTKALVSSVPRKPPKPCAARHTHHPQNSANAVGPNNARGRPSPARATRFRAKNPARPTTENQPSRGARPRHRHQARKQPNPNVSQEESGKTETGIVSKPSSSRDQRPSNPTTGRSPITNGTSTLGKNRMSQGTQR